MSVAAYFPATTANAQITETIVRGNATANAAPTAGEFPAPTVRDRAAVMLSSGSIEFWSFATGSWLRQGIATGGGSVTETIVRANTTQSVAPTALEFAAPTTSDRAVVMLADGMIELWSFATGVWVRQGVGSEVQLVASIPSATATSPKVAVNVANGRVYFRDDLGAGVFTYTEILTASTPNEVSLVTAVPSATATSAEIVVNVTNGRVYYRDDLGGGVYTYTEHTS